MPAHDEADVIARTISSLQAQTRLPDQIVIVADNCSDDTAAIAASFPGVTVMETVDNTYRKVGALSQAWERYGDRFDLWFGVDADTSLDPRCLELLEDELVSSTKVGGIMARYTFDQDQANGRGRLASLLVRLQRFEFAGWVNDILHHDRRTYVLGGQATLFRVEALAQVAARPDREAPWLRSAQVEDMELTWQLEHLGWETLVSSEARAYVGPMFDLRSLWAQRRKWDSGMCDILRNEGVNSVTAYPWMLQVKMGLDTVLRAGFVTLLVASLVLSAWTWFWIWAFPPLLAILLNLRTAWVMPHRRNVDLALAVTLIAAEAFLWFRLAVWAVSWIHHLAGNRYDGWARQYAAERKLTGAHNG